MGALAGLRFFKLGVETQENCLEAIKGALQGDQGFSPAQGRRPAELSAAASCARLSHAAPRHKHRGLPVVGG